ncbi:class I SAM-dependent methyltransferase [candidate division WOR-3 bacterium]|nr:class I SAM-dependent methyltransferase [candidate division WOR-3 bacterium]
MNLFEIKDECRKNLNKYTKKAFQKIPEIKKPLILDAGSGTGVPALSIIEYTDGVIYAVDNDEESIKWFRKIVSEKKLNDRIKIIDNSILRPGLFNFKFDIILAEGLLNAIGFYKGLETLLKYLKNGGFLIIHDEFRDDPMKRRHFRNNHLSLLGIIEISEDVWLNDYFSCMEKKLKMYVENNIAEKELSLIENQKKNAENLKSIYYILRNHY